MREMSAVDLCDAQMECDARSSRSLKSGSARKEANAAGPKECVSRAVENNNNNSIRGATEQGERKNVFVNCMTNKTQSRRMRVKERKNPYRAWDAERHNAIHRPPKAGVVGAVAQH